MSPHCSKQEKYEQQKHGSLEGSADNKTTLLVGQFDPETGMGFFSSPAQL